MTAKILAACFALALPACFDSIVSDQCAPSYTFDGSRCVASNTGPAPDAGGPAIPVGGGDAGMQPDGPACSMDLQTDPLNCGTCGNACASGACSAGACVGALPGQIVAIGHDFAHANAAMTRVLGDALALAPHANVAVMRMDDDGPSTAVTAAIDSGLAQVGRTWHTLATPVTPSAGAFAAADVVVVEPRHGDGDALDAAGAAWQPAFAQLLARGGIVVVLEGNTSLSYRFAHGAQLYSIDPPVDVTGQLVTVTNGADAVTQQVVSPYFADTTSVALPGGTSPVIGTSDGQPVVLHVAL